MQAFKQTPLLDLGTQSLLEQYQEDLQRQLLAFASRTFENIYAKQLDKNIAQMMAAELDPRDYELFANCYLIWQIFLKRVKANKTAATIFYQELKKQKLTTPLLQMVKQWQHAAPSIYEVVEHCNKRTIKIRDILTDTEYTCGMSEEIPPIKSLIIGFLIDIGMRKEFFCFFLDINQQDTIKKVKEELLALLDGQKDGVIKHYPKIIIKVLQAARSEQAAKSVIRLSDSQKLVLDDYLKNVNSAYSKSTHEFIDNLWHKFCQKNDPKMKKPEIFTAALEYLAAQIEKDDQATQSVLAKKYQTTGSSLSNKYRQVMDFAKEDAAEYISLLKKNEKVSAS
ncbi:hypothetical protein [Scopulibacillus cellulosilyticus]|uniref:Uncharacterized protein n=1 Tax=Scopulibacillus cellulosilyticus TaxID=2665665 RepID=A0ABW2PUK2_9BACL